jgi:hypothetical protein
MDLPCSETKRPLPGGTAYLSTRREVARIVLTTRVFFNQGTPRECGIVEGMVETARALRDLARVGKALRALA